MANVSSTAKTAVRRKPFPVLVVDDSPTDRELACVYLMEAWPFGRVLEVDFAGSAEEAIQKIRNKRFALLVLDWRLPSMPDGELLRQLRREGISIPVVVMSGLSRQDIKTDLSALGATFLEKDQLTPGALFRAMSASWELHGNSLAQLNGQ